MSYNLLQLLFLYHRSLEILLKDLCTSLCFVCVRPNSEKMSVATAKRETQEFNAEIQVSVGKARNINIFCRILNML